MFVIVVWNFVRLRLLSDLWLFALIDLLLCFVRVVWLILNIICFVVCGTVLFDLVLVYVTSLNCVYLF